MLYQHRLVHLYHIFIVLFWLKLFIEEGNGFQNRKLCSKCILQLKNRRLFILGNSYGLEINEAQFIHRF